MLVVVRRRENEQKIVTDKEIEKWTQGEFWQLLLQE